jgi:hypothetical protein
MRPEPAHEVSMRPVLVTLSARATADIPAAELSRVRGLIRLPENRRPRIAELVHVLRLHGRDYPLEPGKDRRLLDVLLDGRLGGDLFGEPPMMITRGGVSYAAMLAEAAPSEFHPDQVLASFAQLGVPATEPIRCHGVNATVADVVRESLGKFHLGQTEIEWSAIAFAAYLESPGPYRNRLGETWTFDDLARELLGRNFASAGCGGVHRLEALTLLFVADSQRKLLSPPVRALLARVLSEKGTAALSSQLASGIWRSDWWSAEGLQPGPWQFSFKNDLDEQLLITGHLAEWLPTVPAEIWEAAKVKNADVGAVIGRAVVWLREVVAKATSEQVRQSFCPFTHASIAVIRASAAEAAH